MCCRPILDNDTPHTYGGMAASGLREEALRGGGGESIADGVRDYNLIRNLMLQLRSRLELKLASSSLLCINLQLIAFFIRETGPRPVVGSLQAKQAKKPSITLNLGTNGLKVTSEPPPPMAGQAGCLQGQDRSAVIYPSSSYAQRRCRLASRLQTNNVRCPAHSSQVSRCNKPLMWSTGSNCPHFLPASDLTLADIGESDAGTGIWNGRVKLYPTFFTGMHTPTSPAEERRLLLMRPVRSGVAYGDFKTVLILAPEYPDVDDPGTTSCAGQATCGSARLSNSAGNRVRPPHASHDRSSTPLLLLKRKIIH
ncbi:hypothetical protein J6590_049239 [Homalodisca vitripennis]|nr:hypothetical protein J6590_049239 [Homalodisca vitripennis]